MVRFRVNVRIVVMVRVSVKVRVMLRVSVRVMVMVRFRVKTKSRRHCEKSLFENMNGIRDSSNLFDNKKTCSMMVGNPMIIISQS